MGAVTGSNQGNKVLHTVKIKPKMILNKENIKRGSYGWYWR